MKNSMLQYYSLLMAIMLLGTFACSHVNSKVSAQTPEMASLGEEATEGAFNMIKTLEGEWAGSFKWTGAIQGSGDLRASYYSVGRQAMAENLINEDGKVTMSSIYHYDSKASLRMTHFCMFNQPRMKATSFESGSQTVNFDFLDITNLPEKDGGHVYGVQLNVIKPDSLHIIFKYRQGEDKLSEELVRLKRIDPDADQT